MSGFYRRLVEIFGGMGVAANVAIVIGVTLLTTAGGLAVVVALPPDHFTHARAARPAPRRHPMLLWSGLVLKNLLGLLVLPLGVIMALPLVPGPGLVFILIGLSLLNFPGKRRLERALVSRPSVLRFFNETRARFGKAPLVLD